MAEELNRNIPGGAGRGRPQPPCLNDRFFTDWLGANPLYKNLFVRNINLHPFINEWSSPEVPSMVYLATAGRAIGLNQQLTNTDQLYAVSMAEMLGSCLPVNLFEAQQAARATFIRAVINLVTYDRLNSLTEATADLYDAGTIDGNLRGVVPDGGFREVGEFLPENITTIEVAIRVLSFIANRARPALQLSGLGIIANTGIAMAKRGTVSVQFLDKVSQGIDADLGKQVQLREEAIKTFYVVFGSYLNDGNIGAVFARWIELVPEHAIRLTLIINQAANSGLTSFITIGRAMKRFPTFEWSRIAVMFPDDWNHFITALGIVNGNVYFGFRKDIGAAKSTLFKSLSYVAKELLIRGNGEAALSRYLGWPRSIPNKNEVDNLILTFVDQLGSDYDDENDQHVNAADAAMNLVADDRYADMFV